MDVEFAHLRDQGIDFAVFFTDAASHLDADRGKLLADLTVAARHAGRRVAKSALAYQDGSQIRYFGTPDLVRYLCSLPVIPAPTHSLSV